MDAVKYFKEKTRMSNSLGSTGGRCIGANCLNCPLSSCNNGKDLLCSDFEAEYSEEAVAIVEKWAAEHPQKTLLQDFIEKYTNAPMRTDGTPHTCPCVIGYEPFDKCENGCIECWNRPIAEKKGYLPCNEDCRKCLACILTRANGEREHVYLR